MRLREGLEETAGFVLQKLGRERWVRSPGSFLHSLCAQPVRSVIEIGAFEGDFSERALRLFPKSTVYALEPLPSAFAGLLRRAERCGDRLLPYQLAVGGQEGTVPMLEQVGLGQASSVHRMTRAGQALWGDRDQRTVDVPMRTLDGFWREVEPEGPLLVNMSVQGLERDVIRGGGNCLSETAVCLLYIQLEPLFEEQVSFAEITAELAACGLHYAGNLEQRHHPNGKPYAAWCAFSRSQTATGTSV